MHFAYFIPVHFYQILILSRNTEWFCWSVSVYNSMKYVYKNIFCQVNGRLERLLIKMNNCVDKLA